MNVALGCDNCSCSDAQNMFQSMKLFASLAAITHPEPGPPTAADAIRSATIGGARTAGSGRAHRRLAGWHGRGPVHHRSHRPSFVPLNSVARQVVFTEGGRGVETVIVDGRVVVADRKITTIDERALREEVAGLMKVLRKDIEAVGERNQRHVALSDGGAAPNLEDRYRHQSLRRRCERLRTLGPCRAVGITYQRVLAEQSGMRERRSGSGHTSNPAEARLTLGLLIRYPHQRLTGSPA